MRRYFKSGKAPSLRVYFDSSAYAKRFVEEPGSQQVEALVQSAFTVGLSIVCFPEIISALNRKVREKRLNKHDYALAKDRLGEDLADIEIITISPRVVAIVTWLLETNPLRALDAIHVGSAIEWNAELFVTSDQRQAAAAKKAKILIEIC